MRDIVCCSTFKILCCYYLTDGTWRNNIQTLEIHYMLYCNHITMAQDRVSMKLEGFVRLDIKGPLSSGKKFTLIYKGCRYELKSLGAFGPGMTTRGITFASFVCSSGGRLKLILIAIIGQHVALLSHWHLNTWKPSVIIPRAKSW